MRRRNHYDVTNAVELSRPQAVSAAVCGLLTGSGADAGETAAVARAFEVFDQLYAGTLRGYQGCDTWYHDAQHSLDCALAFARLANGYEREVAGRERLGGRRLALGTIAALFHDAGYIRRDDDQARNGAEFTSTHVGRSGQFLRNYLQGSEFAPDAPMVAQLVHFTGYELALDAIEVRNPLDRRLGFMLGTADVMAQTSDRCYLEKCRDFLYREFEICGMAGAAQAGKAAPIYHSPEQLLRQTSGFNRKMWGERLNGYFERVHRYMAAHFSLPDPYTRNIEQHMQRVDALSASNQLSALTLRPRAIQAQELRALH